MRPGFLAWFVGLVALVASAAAAQSWSEYRTDDNRFRVEMPGKPVVQTVQIPVGNNETAPMVEAVVRTAGAAYQVSSTTYERRIAQTASADVILDHFRNNMSAGNTYKNQKSLTLGRVPGREFVVVEAGSRNTAVRLYWSRAKLYQLMVTGGAGIETRPDTQRFFDSFEAIAQ